MGKWYLILNGYIVIGSSPIYITHLNGEGYLKVTHQRKCCVSLQGGGHRP